MDYFLLVNGLKQAEEKEDWELVRQLLLREWQNSKDNSKLLIRLGIECWYILTLWDCCINTKNLQYEKFKETLISTTTYGLNNYGSDGKYLGIMGYAISLFPNLFYVDGDDKTYEKWEKRGLDMLKKSYEINPFDIVIQKLYYCSIGKKIVMQQDYKSIIKNIFSNNTIIEKYFMEVLLYDISK